jgi:hypothetical protein
MSVVRRYVQVDREPISASSGEPMYEECECGRWRNWETLEHVEVEALTFDELAERLTPPCSERK